VTGVGVRRFGTPEDVADFVANVFLEVLQSAGSYDPRRGNPVAWLYGLAGNVTAGMRRQQQRVVDAERRLAGRALLDTDDYARVEERIDAASALRRAYEAMQQLGERDRRLLELVAVDGLSIGEAAKVLGVTAVATRVRLLRARTRLRARLSTAEQPAPASPAFVKEERA
jgi:RNA polymerase sigma-70 factor, ECF subfamily